MSSTSADRSISLPQWMKTKISDRYDWEQAALSPPTEGDSFFFIPYPLSSNESKFETAKVDIDAKHIEPTYLTEVTPETRMKKSPTMPEEQMRWNANLKSNLEDASSRSMASMAQNMFSGRLFGSYLTPDSGNNANKSEQGITYNNRQRRNSKSLPASPLSSPKIHRKNPYFTDPFAKPNETGWILSMMSQRKSIEDLAGGVHADSSLGTVSESNSPKIARQNQEHPPELREMNFWSPVSM